MSEALEKLCKLQCTECYIPQDSPLVTAKFLSSKYFAGVADELHRYHLWNMLINDELGRTSKEAVVV